MIFHCFRQDYGERPDLIMDPFLPVVVLMPIEIMVIIGMVNF